MKIFPFIVVQVPIVVDSMKDLASSAYCSLPERLYIVLDGRWD